MIRSAAVTLAALSLPAGGALPTAQAESGASGGEQDPASEEQAPSDDAPPATVHVIVENVGSDRGTVRIALCDTGLSADGCPLRDQHPGFSWIP
jgi:hypothetical protein